MRHIVPAVLLLLAIIHALPLAGVVSSAKLFTLYAVPMADPNLEILMRHRAVLFGVLAAFLAYAAFHPALHRLALLAALASVGSFLLLAWQVGGYNTALLTVVRVDAAALVLLALGGVAHAIGQNQISSQ